MLVHRRVGSSSLNFRILQAYLELDTSMYRTVVTCTDSGCNVQRFDSVQTWSCGSQLGNGGSSIKCWDGFLLRMSDPYDKRLLNITSKNGAESFCEMMIKRRNWSQTLFVLYKEFWPMRSVAAEIDRLVVKQTNKERERERQNILGIGWVQLPSTEYIGNFLEYIGIWIFLGVLAPFSVELDDLPDGILRFVVSRYWCLVPVFWKTVGLSPSFCSVAMPFDALRCLAFVPFSLLFDM